MTDWAPSAHEQRQREEAVEANYQIRIPLPIQSFLWRQTEPFLRRKIGKLYEASCMSFEHVLVENKLQGLPPSLSGAIESITRWQLIDACLPHVMHCASLLLANRNKLGQADKFGVPATKLLHTLHWIFIDFKDEADSCWSKGTYVTFDNIQLFVYLFAPIVNNIKDTDLTFRLSKGLSIWKPMWNFDQPEIEALTRPFGCGKTKKSSMKIKTDKPCSSKSDAACENPHRLTVFDMSVITCLLHQRWSEDGVLWGITYLLKKVQRSLRIKLDDSTTSFKQPHRRCQSLISRRPQVRRKKSVTIMSPQKEAHPEFTRDEDEPQQSKKTDTLTKDKQFSSMTGLWKRSSTSKHTVKQSQRMAGSKRSRKISGANVVRRWSRSAQLDRLPRVWSSSTSSSFNSSSSVLSNTMVHGIQCKRQILPDSSTDSYHRGNRNYSEINTKFSGIRKISESACFAANSLTAQHFSICEVDSLAEDSQAKPIKISANRRWASDVCLNCDESATVIRPKVSSDYYADPDGSVRMEVVLSVLDLTVRRNSGLRVLDVCLQILDCMMQLQLFPETMQDRPAETKTLIRILHGLIRILGCSNGCRQTGHKSATSDKMRSLTRLMITNVFTSHREIFCKYIRSFVKQSPLVDIMDFMHPLITFCVIDVNNCDVRELNNEVLCSNAAAKTYLEDVVIKIAFSEIIDKCLKLENQIYENEYTNLYDDVRHLVQFVRLRHPSVFNKVLLSVMSVPMRKRKEWIKEQEKKKSSPKMPESPITPRTARTARRGGVNLDASPLITKRHEKRNNSNKQNLFRLSMEFLDRSTSTKVVSGAEWSDDEEASFRCAPESDRKRNMFGNIFKPKSQVKSTSYYEPEEESSGNFFGRIIKKKMSRKPEKDEAVGFEDGTKSPFMQNIGISNEGVQPPSEFVVDKKDLSNGLKILQFLMDCCPPGTVPDPSLMGAIMGLESPVVSRAIVFLQCANFVEDCCNGAWPHWMQSRILQSKRCHKNAKFYTVAAKHFHNWGESVSKFIERVISITNDPKTVLGDIRSKEEQRRNFEDDVNEDFYFDMRVNKSGKDCPTALAMVASDFLYQITSYLRDVYPRLPHHEAFPDKHQPVSPHETTGGTTPAQQSKTTSESPNRKSIKFFDQAHAIGSDSLPLKSETYNDIAHARRLSVTRIDSGDISGGNKGLLTSSSTNSNSLSFSGNTLMVPTSNNIYVGGNFSPFSSCSRLSFGSSTSLGTNSLISENPSGHTATRDWKESSNQLFTSGCGGGSSVVRHDSSCSDNLPWLKVMLVLANQQNYLCDHNEFCHPYCHQRIIRSCNRMVNAIHGAIKVRDKLSEVYNDAKQQESHTRGTKFFKYLESRASVLTRTPLCVLLKTFTLLSDEMLVDAQALSWEIMLDGNNCITKAAAPLFLLCAYRIPDEAQTCIMTDLCHSDPINRVRALRNIGILWESRHSVWKDVETRAKHLFRINVPPPSFTFSGSDLGLESTVIPDPPWIPNIINVDEILAQNSTSAQSAALLATDTLSHYKEQKLKKLLQRDSEQRAIARSNFHLTDVPLTQTIVNETRKKENAEDQDEDALNARRLSSRVQSVCSTVSTCDSRKEEWKRLSRTKISSHDTSSQENVYRVDHSAATFPTSPSFPPCIAACIPTILNLTTDVEITKETQSVGDVARHLVSSCLSEDPSLFLHSVVEKLTAKSGQQHALWILGRLPIIVHDISPAIAHVVISHLIECILHNNRLPAANENLIASSLLSITAFVPFVQAIDLKTLKLALRKEQIDTQILITAGTPGAKKLTVWNQGDYYMPTQIDITDNSTFDSVLREALGSIDVPEAEHDSYQLFDIKKKQILCRHCYVRDFYQFRKADYPELNLVPMDRDEGVVLMTQRVIGLKLAEIARLRFAIAGLCHQKNAVDQELNANFLQDEFKKLWSFPRKAMDAEFFLFETKQGEIIRQLDVVQKFYWVELIVTVMLSLSKDFPWEDDLICFMHVLSASLVVHCEEAPLLRRYAAAIIDVVVHLGHSFTLLGYSFILPSILCIYSKHYDNELIRSCLELVLKQMFNVHRHPFLLQVFANAAPLLSKYNWLKLAGETDPKDQLSHKIFFQLLLALLDPNGNDPLQVMSLVKAEKPLTPVDETLNEAESVTFGDYFSYCNIQFALNYAKYCLRLCITVIAYQPESNRTLEMLIVVNSILPCYLEHVQSNNPPTKEYALLNEMAISIRSLLSCVDVLTRTINSNPQHSDQQTQYAKDLGKIEEGPDKESAVERRQTNEEFVAPRDVILQLCTTFYTHARGRLQILKPSNTEEFLNIKSHIRLAEIANSLLKFLTDESLPSVSLGLAYYIKRMLPIVDWSNEAVRPALFLVLKRLDRFFSKISKLSTNKRNSDWRTVSVIVSGLCDLLARQPAVSHIPHLKTFVNMSASRQVSSLGAMGNGQLCKCKTNLNISPTLTPNVIKMIVLQSHILGDGFRLEDIIKPLLATEKPTNVLLNLIIPICLCVAGETPILPHSNDMIGKIKWKLEIPKSDVVFLLNLCVDAVYGKSRKPGTNISQLFWATSPLTKRNNQMDAKVALLALKVIIACFNSQLQGEWFGLAQRIKDVTFQNIGGITMWHFMVFVMCYKTPLIIHLRPFVMRQFMKRNVETVEEVELRTTLERHLNGHQCTPVMITDVIDGFVQEARELRRACQSPVKGPTHVRAKSTRRKLIADRAGCSTSATSHGATTELIPSRFTSFRKVLVTSPSSSPKRTLKQQQLSDDDIPPDENDKLLDRSSDKTTTGNKSPSLVRLISQVLALRKNSNSSTNDEAGECSTSARLANFTPPDITVDMYETQGRSVKRQASMPASHFSRDSKGKTKDKLRLQQRRRRTTSDSRDRKEVAELTLLKSESPSSCEVSGSEAEAQPEHHVFVDAKKKMNKLMANASFRR